MPTREEMRQDYQRKKTLHKSALMFLYTLGVLGAGIAFQDELQGGFEKIQTYASNTNQTGTVQEEAKQMARTNSDMVAQTNGKADLTNEEALEIFNQLFPEAAQNKAKQAEQTNSNMAEQMNVGMESIVPHTSEILKQVFEGITPPSVTIPLRVDSAVNVAGREGVKTDGFVMKGFKAAGLLKRLSNLQGGKSLLLNKGQNSLTDVKLSQFQKFEKMGLERTVGTVQMGCRLTKEMCSFAESAQKAGVSKADISFITQKLAGDIELGHMKKGDTFEVMTGTNKDGAREVVYVALTVQGKKHERYAWTDKNGERNFYMPDGVLPDKKIMKFPVEACKRISSPFGVRKHPVTGDVKMHKGVDLALPTGTPIKAAADGVVSYVGHDAGYGNWVEIKHKNGYKTRYAHLNQFEKGLKKGTKVHAGQNIAQGGNTGISTGSHLHYEVRIDGKPVNPMSAYRLEGAKKLGAEQMGEFLAFVDVVHKGPSNLFHKNLKGALAHASLNENGKKSASISIKNTNRIPAVSFQQRKTARGS